MRPTTVKLRCLTYPLAEENNFILGVLDFIFVFMGNRDYVTYIIICMCPRYVLLLFSLQMPEG